MEFTEVHFDFGEGLAPAHIEYTPERLDEVRRGKNVDPDKLQILRVDPNGPEPFASEIEDRETAEELRRALIKSSSYFKLVDVVIKRTGDRIKLSFNLLL